MFFRKRRIYLDYAGATPILPEVVRSICDAEATFGNPGSIHAEGALAQKTLDSARQGVAHELACKARQVVFTSGLTESNNLAILGLARKLPLSGEFEGSHWITTSVEHSSVLECFAEVERLGGTVTHLDPDERGIISAEKLRSALKSNTVLVSIGWANNETGVVQKLSEFSRIIRAHESTRPILFHSDAGQAPLYLSPQIHTLGVHMLSIGAGKLYGPRGIGALYVEDLQTIASVLLGGGQEKGLRAGTEKVSSAVGFAVALEIIGKERKAEAARLEKLRDAFAREIQKNIPGVIVNGDLRYTLPHMLNISVPGEKSGEYLVLALDHAGVALSTRSACRAGDRASHVVAALAAASEALAKETGSSWRAENTLRFSFGCSTIHAELQKTLVVLMKTLGLEQ